MNDVSGYSVENSKRMFDAWRQFAGKLTCIGVMEQIVRIREHAKYMSGLTDNEGNAGRHFAIIVYLCWKLGCSAVAAIATAHEYGQWGVDTKRDKANNKYALGWYSRHESYARDKIGHFPSGGDIDWLIHHGADLMHWGYMFQKVCDLNLWRCVGRFEG